MWSMTGNPRVFVWIALAAVLWLNWEAWMRDYAPTPPPTAAASTQTGPNGTKPSSFGDSVPQASSSSNAAGNADKTPSPASGSAPAAAPGQVEAANAPPTGGKVHVLTD